MRMKWFLILIVFLLHIPSAIAQEQNTGNPFLDNPDREESWNKVEEGNGVVMYNRDTEKSVVKGAKYKDCKGVVKINTTLNSIIRLLEDPAACTAWIYQCDGGERVSEDDVNEISKKERIRKLAENESIKHFKDANGYDSVVRNTRIPDVARKVVTISIKSEYDLIPNEPEYTRIERVYGKWELSPISTNTVEVIYELYSEPPGAFLKVVNLFGSPVDDGIHKNMLETLKGMKKVLECKRDSNCTHSVDCQKYKEGENYVNEKKFE